MSGVFIMGVVTARGMEISPGSASESLSQPSHCWYLANPGGMLRILLKELEGSFDSIGLVYIMVKLFLLLFRPPEIMYQMNHGRYGTSCRYPFIQHPDSQVFAIYITHTWRVCIYYSSIIYFATLSTSRNYVLWVVQYHHPSIFFNIWTVRYKVYYTTIWREFIKYRLLRANPWELIDMTWCNTCPCARSAAIQVWHICTLHCRKSKNTCLTLSSIHDQVWRKLNVWHHGLR